MEEFKKVLDVFKDYLEKDGNVEIITTSRGITVGVWDEKHRQWEDFVNCASPKELCEEMSRQYVAFYEADAVIEKGNDLTEEERQPILAHCAALCLACGFSPLEDESLQGFLPADKPLTALSLLDAKIYVHLSTPELGKAFMEQAEAEGFTFFDGAKPTSRPDETIVCLNPDHTLSFIGIFGRQAYGSGTRTTCGKTLIRVEYDELFPG
ncbi:MAG: hypothetical protein IKO68_00310 [Oscillospiraceae bacterium]|nr:hypothetical protein [Oscillospiraceae bacterium]